MSNMDKLKIGIGFYGLPRASAVTLPSIMANIIDPARGLSETIVRYHFFQQHCVYNPGTNENAELAVENFTLFQEAFEGFLESPGGIPEKRGFEAIKQFGDAWENQFVSLRNLLMQLHSLHHVTQQLLRETPDIVVFARPDLQYHDSFAKELASAIEDSQSVARLPDWQWCGGYNDRFCICGREAIMPFGYRIDSIGRYLDLLQRPLHSERLLQFALDTAGVRVHPVSLRASRVRAGGAVKQEKFRPAGMSRRVRWRIREMLKSVLLRI
jgi:hypothetical protein